MNTRKEETNSRDSHVYTLHHKDGSTLRCVVEKVNGEWKARVTRGNDTVKGEGPTSGDALKDLLSKAGMWSHGLTLWLTKLNRIETPWAWKRDGK